MATKTLQELLTAAKRIRDEKEMHANTATRVGQLFEDIISTFNSGELLEQFFEHFLRSDQPDIAGFLITFLKGLAIGQNGSGIKVLPDGTSQAVVDRLYVKIKAYFDELEVQRKTHVGGSQILSPAGMKCIRVDETDTAYRCYIKAQEDGIELQEIRNTFSVGQLGMMRECNIKVGVNKHAGNRYFWREVVGVGPDFIDISKDIKDPHSDNDVPVPGDDIIGLGHRTDISRQSAIVLSSVDDSAPSIIFYQGINDFSLTDKEIIELKFDRASGHALMNVYGETYIGARDKSSYFKFVPGVGAEMKGKLIIKGKDGNDKVIDEDALGGGQAAEDAKKRLDQWAADGVISPVEKRGLKEEIARIDSDHTLINSNYGKYAATLGEPTKYNSAYTKYRNQLATLSAVEPETIPIPSDFAQDLNTYYSERSSSLATIEEASKKYTEDTKTIADAAKKRLDEWAADGTISPVEKQSLKEEISRINSDHENINANYTKYELGTPDAYNSAFSKYRDQLVTLSAAEPESIPIPEDFSANMERYYSERTKAMNAIEVIVSVGAENLLRNTGFTGDYKSVDLSANTELTADSEMYSPRLEYWEGAATVVEDTQSASGYAANLGGISQEAYLIPNESHVLSFKAKGTDITYSVNGQVNQKALTGNYQRFVLKFISQTSNKIIFSGNCVLCEVKLERGTTATDWCPHRQDRNAVADDLKKFWYLLEALGATTSIDGGMILTTIIRLGQWQDGKMKKVNGAISGIYNDDDDIAFCFGGDIDKAIYTVKLYREDPLYQPTQDELKNIAKVVVTHGGRAILTDVILRGYVIAEGGVFRGRVIAESGEFNNIHSKDGKFSIDGDGRAHMVDGTFEGAIKRPWAQAVRKLIYHDANKDIWGYDCSPSTHDKIIYQGLVPGDIYLSWGKEASGRDIMIWNDSKTILPGGGVKQKVNIPSGYAIFHAGAVYNSEASYYIAAGTIVCMTSCDAGWIVTNVIDMTTKEKDVTA